MHRKGGKRVSLIAVLLLFSFWGIGLPASTEAQDRKWFDLSDVNPVGKALDSVEGLVPGLMLKGFLANQTRFELAGKSNNNPQQGSLLIPGRRKQWDFDNIEWQAELEMRYKLNPSVEFVGIVDYQYDAIYDWDHFWRDAFRIDPDGPLGPAPVRRISNKWIENEMETYHKTEQILRELYANLFLGPVTLTLGKQQTVWGKIDFKVIDIVNPSADGLLGAIASLGADGEWRRMPTWSAKGLYTFGDGKYYLEGTWVPDFEPNDIVFPYYSMFAANIFNPSVPRPLAPAGLAGRKTDKPSDSIGNNDWFFRFGFNLAGWDGFLFYGYHWNDAPVTFQRLMPNSDCGILPNGARGTGRFDCRAERKHTRLNSWGATFDKTFWFMGRNWTFITEGLYEKGRYSGYRAKTSNPLPGPTWPANTTDRIGTARTIAPNPEAAHQARCRAGDRSECGHKSDGLAKRDFMNLGFEIETFAMQGDLQIIALYTPRFTLGWNDRISGAGGINHDRVDIWFYAFNYKFGQTEDRLRISWGNRYIPTTGSNRFIIGGSYVFSDYLKALVNVNIWQDKGNADDFGDSSHHDRDLVEVRMFYNF